MRLRTKLLQAGKTATGIELPARIVETLGSDKRPAVRLTINGYTFRSTVAVMGGKYMVGVSAEVREAAGVAGGEMVDVDIELDTETREASVPTELRKALAHNPGAAWAFEKLSYSKKRLYTVPIEKAKTDETRLRHIERAMGELSALAKC